jgi:hypothetical protein
MTARSIHLPSLGHARRLLNELDQSVEMLTDETITTLHRRARSSDQTWQPDAAETVTSAGDGYPGGTLGGGSSSACNCDVDALDRGELVCPHGSSTERAALGHTMSDPVLVGIGEFFAELTEAHAVLVRLSRRAKALMTVAEERRGRESSIDTCRACGRMVTGAEQDRLRQGACPACYQSYRRWAEGQDDPSWVRFISQTRPQQCDLCDDEGFIVDRYDAEQRPCPRCSSKAAAS